MQIPEELIETARRAADLAEGLPREPTGTPLVTLVMDSEEAGVVMDALIAHQLASSRRHAEAVERGDTVSTTDVRARMCTELLDRLLHGTL